MKRVLNNKKKGYYIFSSRTKTIGKKNGGENRAGLGRTGKRDLQRTNFKRRENIPIRLTPKLNLAF